MSKKEIKIYLIVEKGRTKGKQVGRTLARNSAKIQPSAAEEEGSEEEERGVWKSGKIFAINCSVIRLFINILFYRRIFYYN